MTDDHPRDPTPRPGTGPDGPDAGGGAPDPLDELASAVLDGEIGGDEAHAALRRPEVAHRVAQLAAVRDAVSSPVPPPDDARRDTAIGAALDAFDAGGATAPPGEPVAGDELAAARARAERRARATRWLGAAAALIVVVVLGLALAQLGGRSGDDAETASDLATEEAERSTAAGDDAGADAEAGDGGAAADEGAGAADDADGTVAQEDAAPEATAAPDLGGVALGTFASAEDLLDAVAADLDTLRDARAADGASASEFLQDRCAGAVPSAVAGADGDRWLVAWGTVDGARVDVWFGGTDADPRLVALDGGCSVLASRPAP